MPSDRVSDRASDADAIGSCGDGKIHVPGEAPTHSVSI